MELTTWAFLLRVLTLGVGLMLMTKAVLRLNAPYPAGSTSKSQSFIIGILCTLVGAMGLMGWV